MGGHKANPFWGIWIFSETTHFPHGSVQPYDRVTKGVGILKHQSSEIFVVEPEAQTKMLILAKCSLRKQPTFRKVAK